MPRYDYHCAACAEEFELNENGEQKCPICGTLMRRRWSPIAFSVEDGTGAYTQARKDQSKRARDEKR